jgi:hypothetical protein
MRNHRWFALAVAALPVAGCTIDDSAGNATGDQATAQTEQLSSWGYYYDKQRQDNLPTSANSMDLGTNDWQSCFLAGVAGNIESEYGAPEPAGVLYGFAAAGVYTDSGHLMLEAFTAAGWEKLHARAMCFNTTAGRSGVYTYDSDSDSSATKMAADDGSHVCFLRRIVNTQWYYADTDFSSSSDEILIFSAGGYWYLGGTGNVHAEAQCIKVQQNLGEWSWVGGGTIDLAQNDLNPGTQCFLTGYRGKLRDNDYDNGAFIWYDNGLLQWKLTVSSGKKAWARCVK